MNRNQLIVFLLACFLLGVGAQLWQKRQSETPTSKPPAEFSLPDLDGQMRSTAEWTGQPLLINFWASWCPPCVREIPILESVYQQYADRGLVVVGIAMEPPEDAAAWLADRPVSFPVLHGEFDAYPIAKAYGNDSGSIPFTVLVDSKGQVRQRYSGEVARERLEDHLKAVLPPA